jgi:hypothetical protein
VTFPMAARLSQQPLLKPIQAGAARSGRALFIFQRRAGASSTAPARGGASPLLPSGACCAWIVSG